MLLNDGDLLYLVRVAVITDDNGHFEENVGGSSAFFIVLRVEVAQGFSPHDCSSTPLSLLPIARATIKLLFTLFYHRLSFLALVLLLVVL